MSVDKNTEKLITKGNELFERLEKRSRYLDQPHALLDVEETTTLANDFKSLGEEIPKLTELKSFDDVYLSELARICQYNFDELSEALNPRIQSPQEILDKYNVQEEDINVLKDWILTNSNAVLTANRHRQDLYAHEDITRIAVEGPDIRHEAEKLAFEYVDLIKDLLGSFFKDYPGVSAILTNNRLTIDSVNSRSFSNPISRQTLLSLRNFLYVTKDGLKISLEEFIRLVGHEYIGHARNYVLTEASSLPYFIKQNNYKMIKSNAESVAGYFENAFFEYILKKPEVHKLLCKNEPYEEIYQRYKEVRILADYWSNRFSVGLWVLSHTTQNDYDKQNQELLKYSIEPRWPSNFINRFRNEWNRSTGLLLPAPVSELRYSVDSVGKIIKNTDNKDIDRVEELILTGYWSTQGVGEWVKVNLENDKKLKKTN